ncbi:TPA: endolytic transglycosylase MltG, partial [Legionella pneumophila]|nr:endolytic transglycosylase MltG [Legionella pneumophila]
RGLPPTPIAMVGKEAIDAAAHPQLSNYLYFVAKGDGTHQFSETYEQQRQAINQYRRKDY